MKIGTVFDPKLTVRSNYIFLPLEGATVEVSSVVGVLLVVAATLFHAQAVPIFELFSIETPKLELIFANII